VPTPAHEAVRDLVRLREDIKAERRRAIQRLKSFLLRHGCRYAGRAEGWSQPYENWLRSLRLDEPCAQEALDHMVASAQARHAELRAMDARIEDLADEPPLADAVRRLRALKGIDTLTAATIAAEVADFAAFPRAASFMAFVGLVPSEHSSGQRDRRGSITKMGNAHVRRVLVEAAWAYRHHPAVGAKLRRRQEGARTELVALAWSAQQRLHTKYRRLALAKPPTVAVTAVARELAGFVWAVMQERYAS
jgi:transposase